MQQPIKTLADKPKPTVFCTGSVLEVAPSKLSKKGSFMVTQFTVRLNEPATEQARNGAKVYFNWNPAWFRKDFDIIALDAMVSKLQTQAEAGDSEATEQLKIYNSQYFVAKTSIFADHFKEVSTIRGLIGGRTWDEHDANWRAFINAAYLIGEANPGSAEDEEVEAVAQKNIVAGVDELLRTMFASDSTAGKFCMLQYGPKSEKVLDEDGNQLIDEEGKKVYAPSKYSNVLKWLIPSPKRDSVAVLRGLRDAAVKPGAKSLYAVADESPWGTVPF